jgi:hypothetical protein
MKRKVLVGILLVCLVVGTIPINIAQTTTTTTTSEISDDDIAVVHILEEGKPSYYKIKLKNNLWGSELKVYFDENFDNCVGTIRARTLPVGERWGTVTYPQLPGSVEVIGGGNTYSKSPLSVSAEYTILKEYRCVDPVNDKNGDETSIIVFKEIPNPDKPKNQFLFVEISSEADDLGRIGLTDNIANSLKQGSISFSVSEDVDIDFDNMAVYIPKDKNSLYKGYPPYYDPVRYKEIPHADESTLVADTIKYIVSPFIGPVISTSDYVEKLRRELMDPNIIIGNENQYPETMMFSENERDIISVAWIPEKELFGFTSAGYEGVVVKFPITLPDNNQQDVYIYGNYRVVTPQWEDPTGATIEYNDKIVLNTDNAQPDLIITSLSWSPEKPEEGDEVTFSYTIKNQGTGKAGTSTTALFINGNNVCENDVSRLDSGSYSEETFEDKWTATAGVFGVHVHEIRVVADYYEYVEESEEGNNEMIKPLGDISKLIDELVSRWNELIKFLNSLTS